MVTTTVEYKIKCMSYLTYKTLNDLAEYFHLAPIGSSEENIGKRLEDFHFGEKTKFDFEAFLDIPFEEQKCCASCKHKCYVCNTGECVQVVDCVKAPCNNCGKVSNKCLFQQLTSAVCIFKNLFAVCHSEDFLNFEQNDEFVFPQFPFCYTVELLWEHVNTATEFALDFLLKTGFIIEEDTKDRLMELRLVLKLSKQKLAFVFGESVSDMFPNLLSDQEDNAVDDEKLPQSQSGLYSSLLF